ncbi:hypothetical protein BDA99DRAFT_540335 [Phascolomyces articulosus]|uniref:Uncharacterized protein n=1 Tax=Phascolomyces articulosus TaxID=60185 RepID=A0AAD5JU87_9FUNG|nr:hypothetical protein BDA99DRAFT_540335 [Phascolomyces articulosus]
MIIQHYVAITSPLPPFTSYTTFSNTGTSPSHQLDNNNNNELSYPSMNYQAIISNLLPLYIKLRNPYNGYLHAPTFEQYYDNLSRPLTDSVVLSMVSEYDIDIYDDLRRRLETVMTMSLLQPYLMYILHNYIEAQRMVTVALIICSDLEGSYNRYKMTPPIKRITYQRHNTSLKIVNRTLNNIYFEGKVDYCIYEKRGII